MKYQKTPKAIQHNTVQFTKDSQRQNELPRAGLRQMLNHQVLIACNNRKTALLLLELSCPYIDSLPNLTSAAFLHRYCLCDLNLDAHPRDSTEVYSYIVDIHLIAWCMYCNYII